MNVKAHYDNHLGNFYSWMVGDFHTAKQSQRHFFEQNQILPEQSQIAIDLGAGHGTHSTALAELGFSVKAIDFNSQLLEELRKNTVGHDVAIHEDDIRNIRNYAQPRPTLILCMGDTLTHLDSPADIEAFITNCHTCLEENGKLVLSFRDYTTATEGKNRFIPVKSDDQRILTCFLEYLPDKVKVTDLLYEKSETGWEQKVSTYEKVRLQTTDVLNILSTLNMKVVFHEIVNRLVTIIAQKS